MAKVTRPQGESEARGTILDATTALLREHRTGNVTTDQVAKRAGPVAGTHQRDRTRLQDGSDPGSRHDSTSGQLGQDNAC